MKTVQKDFGVLKIPDKWRFKSREGDYLLFDSDDKELMEEMLFHSEKNFIFPSRLRSDFENDSIIVLLFEEEGNILLHRRSEDKSWAPGKIDLASVAGQSRAIYEKGEFKRETPEQTARREIREETGLDGLDFNQLEKIGEHYNPDTLENQAIFGCTVDFEIEKLNQKAPEEVKEWIREDFGKVMSEYFGKGVEKYAGGRELRPKNFISDPKIKENLEKFHSSLQ